MQGERDKREPTPDQVALLNKQSQKYLMDLQAIPQLAGSIFVEHFGPENNPFGKGPWTGVTFKVQAANGLEVGTTDGDGYCTYDLWLRDSSESYFYEHEFEDEILGFLKDLFADRMVAYLSFFEGVMVASGLKDLTTGTPDSGRDYHLSAGCLFPFKARNKVLTHNLKSWNGVHDGTIQTMGYY